MTSPTLQLRTAIETHLKDGPQSLDILEWMGRTALELVGQGGLGYSFDPLVAESHDEFAEAVKSFVYVLQSTLIYTVVAEERPSIV